MLTKVKPKKCKGCHAPFIPSRPLQVACGIQCAQGLAATKREKEAAKREQEERRVIRERIKAIQPRQEIVERIKKKAQLAARIRDWDKGCISCGILDANEYHGGHCYAANKYPLLRYDWKRNIHKQCLQCNKHLHGNQIPFIEALKTKLEPKEFATLQELSKVTTYKHSRQELIEIENAINADLKQLRKERE